MSDLLTLDHIRAAHGRIRESIVATPTLHSQTLSKLTGANIYLKFENLQFTAAYKERGALNALLLLTDEQRSKGVIAASAGNHAQGLSYHGTRLGIPVTIVMPIPTPTVKVMQTESVGGKVVLHGETFDDAYKHARLLEAEQGLTFVHPFDDPDVAAGQGTVALEMLESIPSLDMLVVPIGGGGLLSGMGTAARALKPDIGLIGVQAELYPSMYALLKNQQLPCEGDTLAEGIAVKIPGSFTSEVIRDLVDDIVLVSEAQLETAVSLLLQIEKTVVEGAGAAGLAAVMANPDIFRLARLRLTLQDRPGALYKVMRLFNEHNVNIIEIYHQRIFTTLPAKGLITDIECEARDAEQLQGLVDGLNGAGYLVERVELNK